MPGCGRRRSGLRALAELPFPAGCRAGEHPRVHSVCSADAARRETREETNLTVSSVDRYLGHFDYENSRGTTTRQFNFAVTVTETSPVVLTEHDLHQWAALTGDLPGVTDGVRKVLTSA
ncbi:NUDIX hydrolase [Streptomyces sp. NPDC018352]|uniref:NUDIX hydrolase n=1 Tax=Streptomyces sp. NPDC018352 TaxID=3157194 RepID=UPI00340F4C47